MRISWNNLHYFVLGAIMINFIFLYALSVNKMKQEKRAVVIENLNDISLGSYAPTIDNANSLSSAKLLKQSNETQTRAKDGDYKQGFDTRTNTSDSSVAEDIGKSISTGKTHPIPGVANNQQLLKSKENSSSTSSKSAGTTNLLMFLILAIFACGFGIFLFEYYTKRKLHNETASDSNNKYILLDTENN